MAGKGELAETKNSSSQRRALLVSHASSEQSAWTDSRSMKTGHPWAYEHTDSLAASEEDRLSSESELTSLLEDLPRALPALEHVS